jgi:hypothetical protein
MKNECSHREGAAYNVARGFVMLNCGSFTVGGFVPAYQLLSGRACALGHGHPHTEHDERCHEIAPLDANGGSCRYMAAGNRGARNLLSVCDRSCFALRGNGHCCRSTYGLRLRPAEARKRGPAAMTDWSYVMYSVRASKQHVCRAGYGRSDA